MPKKPAMLAAILSAAPGWVTQMQSKYGVRPSAVAQAWDGIEASAGPVRCFPQTHPLILACKPETHRM